MSDTYAGRIDINPNCIGTEFPEVNMELAKRLLNVLKVVFFRLGHSMRIYMVEIDETSVTSDSEDQKEVREVQNICNIVFFTYFEHEHNAITTLKCLEDCKFIPSAKVHA